MNDENNKDQSLPAVSDDPHILFADIVGEMERAYLDYSMSVIVDRALPDVRDGMKPVHRRILFAMHGLGLKPEAKFRKSATIVGEVLGKFHPHGDTAVYDALVRMAQDFSMRYTLINGQGNFGSMDGDSAAAMRYTEAKMAGISREMLLDIEKDTVNFIPNYDGSQYEPSVLPARVPNLLINGVSGIAVGMATNIPPHNLNEIANATQAYIKNPDITVEELLNYVKGPDFPTGGEIFDKSNMMEVYATGRGPIVTRAKAEIVERTKSAFDIVITEMTYQTNKATLIEKLADLVRDKRIQGIKDIRDESDKDGVRVVIELKSEAYPQKVLNTLFKMTDLQKTFHVNMLALVDGIEPRTLGLKHILHYYVEHRKKVIVRRTQFELKNAKKRAHILEGLKRALDFIDEIISTIRASATKEKAFVNLVEKFEFSDAQAKAILEMRLQTLAGLERQKILDELAEILKFIAELESILASDKRVLELIDTDLNEVKARYGDERKTLVKDDGIGEFKETDFIPDEPTIVVMTQAGYIKRINPTQYKLQKRGGTGSSGMKMREEDVIKEFIHTTTHKKLLFFTKSGKVFRLEAYNIPEGSRQSKGQSIVNFLNLSSDDGVESILPVDATEKGYAIIFATSNGVIKKTELTEFANIRQGGIIAIGLRPGDALVGVSKVFEGNDVVLVSSHGKSIRFKEEDVRSMGRMASGVRGINLKEDDVLVGMSVVTRDSEGWLLIASEKGYGKKTLMNHYKLQNRSGSGMKTANVTTKTGTLIGAKFVFDAKHELILVSSGGNLIKLQAKDVPTLGRDTQGVRVMKLTKGDRLVALALNTTPEEIE
jgi:DNA gyrase subunit A